MLLPNISLLHHKTTFGKLKFKRMFENKSKSEMKLSLWPSCFLGFLICLFLMVSCQPNKRSESPSPESGTEQTKVKEKENLPKISVFLDYTKSMQGYYTTGEMVSNIGKLQGYAKRNGYQIEFWRYGQKSTTERGSVCERVADKDAKDVTTFLDNDLFTWIANDYTVAFDKMLSLLKADQNRICILITDGVPTVYGRDGLSTNDMAMAQAQISGQLEDWAKNDESACSMISCKCSFNGDIFKKDGNKLNVTTPRPIYALAFYNKEMSEHLDQISKSFDHVTSTYHYNNSNLGLYELGNPTFIPSTKNEDEKLLRFTIRQVHQGPNRDQFDVNKLYITYNGKKVPALKWTVKNLPKITSAEVSTAFDLTTLREMSDWVKQSPNKNEVLLCYEAVSPAGILLNGFSTTSQLKPAGYDQDPTSFESTLTRDLSVLIKGTYQSFESKPSFSKKLNVPTIK